MEEHQYKPISLLKQLSQGPEVKQSANRTRTRRDEITMLLQSGHAQY